MDRKFLIVPDWNNLEKSVEIAKAHNAGFEYDDFFDPKVYMDEEETDKRIARYLSMGRDTSMDTLHGVFFDLAPNSTDPVVRTHCRSLMDKSFEIAARLGCRGVVFHTGIIAGLKLPVYQQGWLESMEVIYRELCAANPELELYLENSTEQEPDLLVRMAERMSDVPNFKLCLDYAHASITETPVGAWAKNMGPYIGHVHLNDNDGISDLHQVPGEGTMDYEEFARIADKFFPQVPVLLEVTGAEKSEKALEYMEKVEAVDEVMNQGQEITLTVPTLMEVLDTTLAISRSKDKTALLNLILNKSMEVANCDAGTLYVLKEDGLHFMIMKTLSLGVDKGGDGTPIDLPPVKLTKTNVCAYSALEAKIVNVPDVYKNDDFDFSGPKNYDKMTGYLTRSMLTVPLMDQDSKVLGVMQLLNARDNQDRLCEFDYSMVRMIEILAAQATITMQQVNYIEEIRSLIWSFTAALAEAIDQRTPYNGSHTRKVAEYSAMIAELINQKNQAGLETDFFTVNRREQLEMAALLHDIGKMIVPIEVMNKGTRLGSREETVMSRFDMVRAKLLLARLENKISAESADAQIEALDQLKEMIQKYNTAGFIPGDVLEDMRSRIEAAFDTGDEKIEILTPYEKDSVLVQKGTLTQEERAIMENHVVSTKTILEKVHFNSDYIMAPVFAAQHHEFLNGKGYPNHISGDEIPLESRILAVADICDALLAEDRPYKKALPKEKAFAILRSMAEEGSLEGRLVEYMIEAIEKKADSESVK